MVRYGEQTCNHYIAFKLLAILRQKVCAALRRLAPAKLDGRDKGDLISVITSDIELLEVFYAHTISPAAIALVMSLLTAAFLAWFHWAYGVLAAGLRHRGHSPPRAGLSPLWGYRQPDAPEGGAAVRLCTGQPAGSG